MGRLGMLSKGWEMGLLPPLLLPCLLPSPLISRKLRVGEQMKQESGNTIPLESKAKIWGQTFKLL